LLLKLVAVETTRHALAVDFQDGNKREILVLAVVVIFVDFYCVFRNVSVVARNSRENIAVQNPRDWGQLEIALYFGGAKRVRLSFFLAKFGNVIVVENHEVADFFYFLFVFLLQFVFDFNLKIVELVLVPGNELHLVEKFGAVQEKVDRHGMNFEHKNDERVELAGRHETLDVVVENVVRNYRLLDGDAVTDFLNKKRFLEVLDLLQLLCGIKFVEHFLYYFFL
jgi:hypothetical protein